MGFPCDQWISVILKPNIIGIPRAEQHHFQLYAALALDMVWFERNKVVHGDSCVDPWLLAQHLRQLCIQHLDAWALNSVTQSLAWKPPAPGVIKVNVDVAVRASFSMAACICRDYGGIILHAETQKLCSVDPTVGEAEALWLGIQVASTCSWRQVLF